MESVPMCTGCKTLPAVQFCLCKFPLEFSCHVCADGHGEEDSSHAYFPLSEARHIIAKPEYISAKSRLKSLQSASTAVKANLPLVSQYLENIELACDTAISYLNELRAKKVAEMRRLEETMEEYIRATMAELYDNVLNSEYRPAPGLATIAWGFRPGAKEVAAQLFVGDYDGIWKKKLEDGLGLNYEITIVGFPHSYLRDEPEAPAQIQTDSSKEAVNLTFVFEDFLLSFDCVTQTWGSEVALSRSIASYGNSASIALDDQSILACGGGLETESHNRCYLISATGQVQPLQQLIVPRSFHSISAHNSTVYLFGGRIHDTPTKRCEKLSTQPRAQLQTRKWQELAQMCYPREGCNPCAHGGKLYLCGGATDGSECFDYALEAFDLLPFRLPDANSPAMTVLVGESLYVVMHEDVLSWELSGRTDANMMKHEEWGSWGNTNPILHNFKIYVASLMMGGIIEIDLRSETSRTFPFPGSE